MESTSGSVLSDLLKKRLKTLGYPSLRKFHAERPGLGLSYEVLRQVVYTGHVPRPETLFRILGSFQFSANQIRKICGLHYGDYLPIQTAIAAETGAPPPSPREPPDFVEPPADDTGGGPPPEEPAEILSRLRAALPRIPIPGNEDFWELAQTVARIADQKVRRTAARLGEQPLLFAGEPEAIYQFLVRRNRIPAFLSRGENLAFAFVDGIDYRDRFIGAILGSAVGETFGTITQGLTPRDVQELYGDVSALPVIRTPQGTGAAASASPLLAVSRSFLPDGLLDPGKAAEALARSVRRDDTPGMAGFARNLLERGLPWHEAGENQPEGAPAVSVLPLALLRAGNFRRLKLEAGIFASLSHPHPASISATIAQACAVARTLHSLPGSLDVLSFPRALSPVIAGIEPERGSKPRTGRTVPTVGRKLGAELPALLLRRAPVIEMQEGLGNGTAAHEGIPFGLGCFLRSPGDFAGAVLPAVHQGGDARCTAAIAGALCGAYIGASGIPDRFLARLPFREELSDAAERLLALSRREG